MNIPRRSMDEISLELTERCIELDSRKYIPSEVGLDYSQTQLSIQEPQEPASPLLHGNHYPHEHLPKIQQSKLHHRYLQFGEGLYGIESPENCDRTRGGHMMMSFHHARDRPRQSESQSLQSKPNKPRGNERTRCGSLGHKLALPPKLSSGEKEKENQQSYNALKLRLEEEKRKYQPFRITFRGWEYKKTSHLHAEGEKSSAAAGFTDILAKKIRLDYNQAQQKKYLQRIILNRQSILHVSQRLSKLPNIQ